MIKSLGRYRIIEEIGSGAMAVVYKAFDPEINRTLAIKILRQDRCIDAEYRNRFLREAKAAGKLSHNNIVTIYDIGEDGGQPYIAMEFLEGIPLDRLISANRNFSAEEIINIMLQLANALHYAHDRGIVHRDIKPSNILYAVDNSGDDAVRITDFGIAHIEDANVTLQTAQGEFLGTPHYMSPEQALGRPVDGRSDLFSLGVILYELLTGRKPFRADSIAALMFRIVTDDPAPIVSTAMAIPDELRLINEKLLRKSPDKRLRSAQDLVQELQRLKRKFEDSEPRRRTGKHLLRRRWTLLTGCVVASIMLLLSLAHIHMHEKSLLQSQNDHGNALLTLIARDAATPLLAQDWITIELIAQDLAGKFGTTDLIIADRTSTVRGAADQTLMGAKFSLAGTHSQSAARNIRYIQSPVLYQKTLVGTVYLGLNAHAANALSIKSVVLMALSALLTIIAAMLACYFYLSLRITAVAARKLSTVHALPEDNSQSEPLPETLTPGAREIKGEVTPN